jgi:hypothetical protein
MIKEKIDPNEGIKIAVIKGDKELRHLWSNPEFQPIIEKIIDRTIKITTSKWSLTFRSDGRIEVVCVHGVGHTVAIPKNIRGKKNRDAWWSHGCDGCCSKKDFPSRKSQWSKLE